MAAPRWLLLAAVMFGSFGDALDYHTKTPAMGWNSYNYYSCYPNEEIMMENARGLVDLGLADLGYTIVTTDCGWPSQNRTSSGQITWNPSLFPSGFPALGEFIHGLGLKFGVYSGGGVWECDTQNGATHLQASRYHELIDAQTFADWGADALKYDYCWATGVFVNYTPMPNTSAPYVAMADALNQVERPIILSICEWGVGWNVGEWASELGDSWRISNDIQDNWASIWRIANEAVPYTEHTGVGKYADMDMLIVGLKFLNDIEEKFHFGLWAINKSPLVIGAPMNTSITPQSSLDILGNTEVIAIDQDPLGEQAKLVRRYTEESYDVWASNLTDSKFLVAVSNWANETTSVSLNLLDLVGLQSSSNMRDVWEAQDLGPVQNGSNPISVQLQGHELKIFVFSDAVIGTPPWQKVDSKYYSAANATLSGLANVRNCLVDNPSPHDCAPTHAKVWNMTVGSTITFQDVAIPQDSWASGNGSSTLVGFDFINYNVALESAWTNGTNTQNLTISVNGGEAKRWAFPISGGDWFETGRLYIELDGLEADGGNEIVVTAPGIDPGPDVVGLEIF